MQESTSLHAIYCVGVDGILEGREVGLNRAMSDLSGVVSGDGGTMAEGGVRGISLCLG